MKLAAATLRSSQLRVGSVRRLQQFQRLCSATPYRTSQSCRAAPPRAPRPASNTLDLASTASSDEDEPLELTAEEQAELQELEALEAAGLLEAELADDDAPSTSYVQFDEEEDAKSREFAAALAKVAWETKGGDVTLLHVAPLVYWTSYIIVVSVFSRPQLLAMLGKMEKEAQATWARDLPQHKKPGRGVWEVLDYGDVVVHVLTQEEREYYDIESFYGAAEEVELPFDAGAGGDVWATKA